MRPLPLPMLSSRLNQVQVPFGRRGGARATSSCCALSHKPKKKASSPASQVFNIREVHIHIDGKGQPAEWDAVAMSPEAKALLQRHAVKASTALKMHDILGFEDVGDLQRLSSDLIAQLELKPLQLEPLAHMLREHQQAAGDSLTSAGQHDDVGQAGTAAEAGTTPATPGAEPGTDGGVQPVRALDVHACVAVMREEAGTVKSIAITPDGRRAVTATQENQLHVWDLQAHACVAALAGHSAEVLAVAVTPDGRRAVSSSRDRSLRVWDLDTYACIASTERVFRSGWVHPVTISPVTRDGQWALYGDGNLLFKWRLDDDWQAWELYGCARSIRSIAVTPDGRLAVTGGEESKLRVWDLEQDMAVGDLEGHAGWVTSVAITPDGRRAVSGSYDVAEPLRVWDLAARACAGAMRGHGSRVNCLAITPDGRRAVSGGVDCKLRVWDLASFSCTGVMEGHGTPVSSVAITPDGRYAVSASYDSDLRMWDLEPGPAPSAAPAGSQLTETS